MSQNTASSRSTPGIVDAAWRHRWLVIASALVFGALGYGASQLQDPVFSATASLTLTDPRESSIFESGGRVDPERYVLQQADLLTSRTILEAAADGLGDVGVRDLEERLTIDRSIELSQLTVTATAGSGEEAAEIANTVAVSYQDFAREQVQSRAETAIAELEPLVEQLQAELDEVRTADDGDPTSAARAQVLTQRMFELDARTQQLAVDAAVFGSGVSIYEPAEPPAAPSAPRPVRTALATALLGGFLGVLGAFWWASGSRAIEDRDEPAGILGAPLLGDVPLLSRSTPDMVDLEEEPGAQEAFQFVLGSVEFALRERGGRSVLVTSALPGAGKTVTSLQLAAAAVREGQRVLLLDGDLRASGLSYLLRSDLLPGLRQLMRDQAADPTQAIYHCWIGKGVRVPIIAAGRHDGHGSYLLPTGGMERIIDRLPEHDLVVLDSAPLLAVADTGTLVNEVDGVVLVVRHRSSRHELELARERLAFTRTPLLGYVYLSPDPPSAAYGYGYGYGQHAAAAVAPTSWSSRLRLRRAHGGDRSPSFVPPPRQEP